MSPDTGVAAEMKDTLDLVAVAVRSRSGVWISVENLAGGCCLLFNLKPAEEPWSVCW
jgi:hypothetical protein